MNATLKLILQLCSLILVSSYVWPFELSDQHIHDPIDVEQDQESDDFFKDFDPLGLFSQDTYSPTVRAISDSHFAEMLAQYKTDLPTLQEAKDRIASLVAERPAMDLVLQQLTNPELFRRAKFPSRLLFVGPSGCGKTTTAKALAKYCDMHCIFLKGSAVGNTYQNSGPTLINNLFQAMIERPDQKFLVIIDELMAVAKFVDDGKEMQQNKTAMALWQALDDCEYHRHICVIGTDNNDPDKLVDQLKTRFKHNIYVFKHAKVDGIVSLMRECLAYPAEGSIILRSMSGRSNAFLKQLAYSVRHLSMRETEDLIEKAKVLAISESKDPHALVMDRHLKRVFDAHQDPNWLSTLWINREKHIKNLLSVRAVSLYMTITGMGLRIYSQQYKDHGTMLATLGMIINHYWPKDEKEASDMPLLSAVSHLFAQTESHSQFKASYAQNQRNQEYAQITHDANVVRQEEWQQKQYRLQELSHDLAKLSHELAVKNSRIAQENHVKDVERAEKQLAMSEQAEGRAQVEHNLRMKETLMRIRKELGEQFGSLSVGLPGFAQYQNSLANMLRYTESLKPLFSEWLTAKIKKLYSPELHQDVMLADALTESVIRDIDAALFRLEKCQTAERRAPQSEGESNEK